MRNCNAQSSVVSIESLKTILARNPFWYAGRSLLASQALEMNDHTLAFAEHYAMKALARNEQQKHDAEFLGAKVLVRSGEFERARAKLENLREHIPPQLWVEEEVACLAALERHEEAVRLINELPEHLQSPELRAVKLFMVRRGDGTLYR